MKTETLEKIRNILEHLFELFIFILIMLITFGSLHVHAAESGIPIFKYTQVVPGSWTKTTTCLLSESCDFDVFCFGDPTGSHKMYVAYINPSSTLYYNESSYIVYDDGKEVTNNPNPQFNQYPTKHYTRYSLSNGIVIYLNTIGGSSNQYTYDVSDKFYNFVDLSAPSDKDAVQDFLESYYVNKTLSPDKVYGPSIDNPDFEDTAYAFTGFTANNKMTATWTGTTERSYLKDQEVEEYVRVNYYFADKEAQDTIKQADAYPDEFATADKTLTIDVSGLKPDDENWFLRYIRITPCYRLAGLGAWGDFYHGSDVYVYFDVKGNIEKVIQKSKPTDLNKGNMVYDSSIGYLQNVIYTEQKTHDGSGRQATFKWSTLKSLPDDAQIEIVAQNFYIEWFNKKTEENFIYKEYGEDCFYSAGSYSFNANTPVWTWLKEKEIDPFSIKTQSYGSTEYYLRIVVYNDSDSLYHYGGWVKVDIKSKDTTIMPSTDVETGGFDDSSGLWNQDTASSDSYHYSTDDKGKLTGNIDVNSWEDLNMNSFTWMYRNMQSMVSSLGEFPAMVYAVFGYLPVQYITSIGVLLVAIVLLRFLGR